MKNLKPRSRPSPEEAIAISAQTAPTLPPTRVDVDDRPTTLNLRVRSTTLEALLSVARERSLTMKQVVCQALADAGVLVAPSDLEDRTPRRKRGGRSI